MSPVAHAFGKGWQITPHVVHQRKHIYLQMHLAAISTAEGDTFQSVKPQDLTVLAQIFLCVYFIMFSGRYTAQFHIGRGTRCPVSPKSALLIITTYTSGEFIMLQKIFCFK